MRTERERLLSQACKQIMDEVESAVKDFRQLQRPLVSDDHATIHSRTLFVTQVENELAYLYRSALKVKHEVDSSKFRAQANLQDKHTEVMDKPTFKSLNGFMSRPEVEIKLRSLAIEENYDVRIWESLSIDVVYLIDVIRSYQQEASRERRDIDTRLRILGLY